MGKRLPVVPAPEMNHEVLEAVGFDKRPRIGIEGSEMSRVTRELATDPSARELFLAAPWQFLSDRGMPLEQSAELGVADGLQLTSEACTAVAICNAAYLLNVWAAENVVQVQKAVNVQLAVNIEAAYNICITQTKGCDVDVFNLASGLDGGAWV